MSTNGLVPFDYDDPRRPRPYVGDDEDGLLGGMMGQDAGFSHNHRDYTVESNVPRGTTVPRGTDSANIQPDAGANPRQGRQPAMLDMPQGASSSEGEDMPFMPQRVHEAVAGGGEGGSEAAAAEVGGLGPIPGTYVAQPQNGRPTLAPIPQQQQNLSTLMPQPSVPAQGQPQPTPISSMQSASDRLSGMARRPATMADVPQDKQHHGWRKAADIAAAIGIGAYTGNPLAGANVYQHMHNAPLRREQETYDSASSKATGDYDRSKQIQAANVGEEKVQALEDRSRVAEERNKAYADKMESTFVAGTERPDANSPTGYSAETVSGKTKPFTPKQDRSITFDPKQGGFTMNGARYVPKTIDEGAALEAGLSTQFPELANGPYTQRWKEEKKNQTPQTHIHNPSAEEEMLHDAKAAFRQQHGRDPQTPEDFDEVNRMRKGEKGTPAHAKDRETFESHWAKRLGPGSAVEKKYDSQRQTVLKAYGADKDPKEYQNNKADIDQKFAEIEANREAEKASLQQEKDAEAEQYGVYGQNRQPAAAPPVQPPAQPAAQQPIEQPIAPVRTPAPVQQKPSPAVPAQAQQVPQGMPQPNTIVNVGGQFHMVKGYNPTTKKPIISKEIYDPQTKQPVTQAQR